MEKRDAEANGIARTDTQAAKLPRILNKHVHGIPKGAYYCGRGSPLGNPFVIGRDGTRDEVCDKYDAWIDRQRHLIPLIASLKGRDLVCFCAPKRCHCETVRRRANPGLFCKPGDPQADARGSKSVEDSQNPARTLRRQAIALRADAFTRG